MTRYIGLDAHSESCTIAVLGQSGKRLRHERLQTSAERLKNFIKEVPRPRYLCMEEGTLSEWLYEELTPLVDKLVVVMPDRNPGNKNDLLDACKLADDLRRDAIRRPVYKAPSCFRSLREAARTHYTLVRDKARAKSRLHALCRGCGRTELGKELYAADARAEALKQLPEHLRARAALLGQQLDALSECASQAERSLYDECRRVPIVRRLATAPGIGIVRAAYIVAVVMTPHRFRTARQFWSYSGLAVVTRSSSDWISDGSGNWRRSKTQQTRGLNHNRHPLLKNVFKGAPLQITLMPEHPLGQAYQRLLKTTKPNLARLTIARRLAAAVLAMWKNGEDYEPSRHGTLTTTM
ncbi:MAG TPA: transposase [Polyangiaceae bacterium]